MDAEVFDEALQSLDDLIDGYNAVEHNPRSLYVPPQRKGDHRGHRHPRAPAASNSTEREREKEREPPFRAACAERSVCVIKHTPPTHPFFLRYSQIVVVGKGTVARRGRLASAAVRRHPPPHGRQGARFGST